MSSSQLGNLKSGLAAYADATKKQASGLDPIMRACEQSSTQILNLIGGSAQRKDAEVQAAVQEAKEQITRAANALRRAADVANGYANTL